MWSAVWLLLWSVCVGKEVFWGGKIVLFCFFPFRLYLFIFFNLIFPLMICFQMLPSLGAMPAVLSSLLAFAVLFYLGAPRVPALRSRGFRSQPSVRSPYSWQFDVTSDSWWQVVLTGSYLTVTQQQLFLLLMNCNTASSNLAGQIYLKGKSFYLNNVLTIALLYNYNNNYIIAI